MKLATFRHASFADGERHVGVVIDDGVVDLAKAAPELPGDLIALLAAGQSALARAHQAAGEGNAIPLAEVQLEAPIQAPRKFLAVGLNYADHVAEAGLDRPERPTIFNKQTSCIVGPHSPIHLPRVSPALDYEGELGFVIGKRCRHVSIDDAPDVIAGYLVVNDVSVRDWQLRIPTWTMGKSFDTHGPIGPWLVTADEMPDPHRLRIRTFVGDELRQDSTTKELIFDCFTLVEHLSTAFTLEPGDIIATGTPGGVGMAQKPPAFLAAGDRVRVEIEGIGQIENEVVAEPEHTAFIE